MQIRREFFPTVVDIVEEIESGYGEFSELLSTQGSKHRRNRNMQTDKDDAPGKRKYGRNTESSNNGSDEDRDEESSEAASIGSGDRKASTDTTSTGTGASADSSIQNTQGESYLRYSRALLGSGSKQIYPLDWTSIQGIFSALEPQEKSNLGVQVSTMHCSRLECSAAD